jgi:tetratricopeptide (TPR) repeat protein
MRRLARTAITLAALTVVAAPALADDMDTCEQGSGPAAVKACTRVIDSNRYKGADLAWALGMRGIHHKLAEEYDLALADYNAALRIEPTAQRYSNRGNLYRLKNETDRALADLAEALKIDSQLPTVYVNRGLIYWEDKHDPDRALADINKALELDPQFPGAYVYLAELYEEKGDIAKAKAGYHQALAVPQKYSDGAWAHKKARERLEELDGRK